MLSPSRSSKCRQCGLQCKGWLLQSWTPPRWRSSTTLVGVSSLKVLPRLQTTMVKQKWQLERDMQSCWCWPWETQSTVSCAKRTASLTSGVTPPTTSSLSLCSSRSLAFLRKLKRLSSTKRCWGLTSKCKRQSCSQRWTSFSACSQIDQCPNSISTNFD